MQQTFTFTIHYRTGNSDRCIGAVNGAFSAEEAIELFAEANEIKLGHARSNGLATIKGRTGTLSTSVPLRSPIVPVKTTINRHKNDEREVLIAKREGWTVEIWPLPNSSFKLLPFPIVSAPFSEPESEPKSGPESEPKTRYEIQPGLTVIDVANDPEYAPRAAELKAKIIAEANPIADGPAIREVAEFLGIDLDSVPISCRSSEAELPLAADQVHRSAALHAGVELYPAQADKLALVVAVGANVTVDRKLPEGSVQVLIGRHGEDTRRTYVLWADGKLSSPLYGEAPLPPAVADAAPALLARHEARTEPEPQPLSEFDPQSLAAVANAPDGCYDDIRAEARTEVLKRLEQARAALEADRAQAGPVADDRRIRLTNEYRAARDEAARAGREFNVTWGYDTYAESPQAAAELAQYVVSEAQHEPDRLFEVTDVESGETFDITLELPKPAPRPKAHVELSQIVAELEELDWELVAAAHEPGDEPFWTIIALRHRPVFPASPYVVCSFNYSGIGSGHYDLTRDRAFRVFADKVADREEV